MRIEGAAVAGIGMVRFDQYPDRSTGELARDAGLLALHDAGITLADVDEAFVGYIQPGQMLGVRAMKELGLTGLPVTHVENASATGLVAFREAAWAVASGRAEVAFPQHFRRYGHFTLGADTTRLVTDGYYEEPDDPPGDCGAWISLVDVDWERGALEWTPLCRHGSSWDSQDSHPHPVFSHAGDEVLFTSDAEGQRAVYAVPASGTNDGNGGVGGLGSPT